MRREKLTALAGAAALVLPAGNAWAALQAAPKKKVVVVKRTVAGDPFDASRWGPLQVRLVVRKTTTTVGTKHTVARKIVSVAVPVYPSHTDRSIYINEQALPYLAQETLQAQFTGAIDMISGATDTSYAFQQSLQSALLLAKKA